MTYSSPGFVVGLRRRVWPTLAFLLVLLYGAWFVVVLLAEQLAWGPDPGAWAALPTRDWAYLGLVLDVGAAIYFLVLLVRREVPATTYTLEGPAEGAAPAFLQSQAPAAPAPGETVTAEAETPKP